MKSALANIGETELSNTALKLEEEGRKRNIAVIPKDTPAFLSALRAVIKKINPNNENIGNEVTDDIQDGDRAYLLENLSIIHEACSGYDKKTAKNTLSQLQQKKWPRDVNELLDTIAKHLLHSEFTEAAKAAMDHIKSLIEK